MQQADVIEAKTWYKRIFDEVDARLWQVGGVLIEVAGDRQDFARRHVDGDTVRDFEASLLAFVLVFVALDVQFAIDLINLAVAVIWVGRGGCDALLRALSVLRRIGRDLVGRVQIGVAVDANDLQALNRAGAHIHPMRDTLGIRQVGGGAVHDQVVSIHALADWAVAQRAEVHLLEGCTAKAQHQQHAVCVGVIFARRAGQVVVHVFFEGVCDLVARQSAAVCVIPNLHGAVSGQQFGSCVGLKAQHGLLQQGVANLGHTFDWRSIRSAVETRYLDLEAEQLDALRAILDPFAAALDVVGNAANQVVGNVLEFDVVDVVNEVVKPALRRCLLVFRVFDRLAIQRQGDRPVTVFDLEDCAVLRNLWDVFWLCVITLNGHVHRADGSVCLVINQSDIRVQA